MRGPTRPHDVLPEHHGRAGRARMARVHGSHARVVVGALRRTRPRPPMPADYGRRPATGVADLGLPRPSGSQAHRPKHPGAVCATTPRVWLRQAPGSRRSGGGRPVPRRGVEARKIGSVSEILRKVDAFQKRHAALAFPFAVVKKFGDDQAGNLAALIAYYGFFSLFPLLLVLVTALGI